MDPAAICFCEFGQADTLLQTNEVDQLKETIKNAWEQNAATEHVRILHDENAPYLTAFRPDRIDCRRHSVVTNLYTASLTRTAQHFLAVVPGKPDDTGINILNVHAPSGKKTLTMPERKTLLRSLLQTPSLRTRTLQIGQDKFLIGGDMNTSPNTFSTILNDSREEGE